MSEHTIYRYKKPIAIFFKSGWIYAYIQGMKYTTPSAQRKWLTVTTVKLERHSENIHDSNAIVVYNSVYMFGYLPRELAAILAPKMDAGEKFICKKVTNLNGPRVRIKSITIPKKKLIRKREVSKRLEDLVL